MLRMDDLYREQYGHVWTVLQFVDLIILYENHVMV